MNILGVSAYFHDSAACLVRDGRIVAAVQEEAFTRRKHEPAFPSHAAQWCLDEGAADWSDVDWFAYYELPALKLQRIRAQSAAVHHGQGGDRAASIPSSRLDVGAMFPEGKRGARVYAVEHHLAHAASAFYPSPFEHAAVVTIDGVGEFTTTSISEGRGNGLHPRSRQSFPHSLGLFYSAFTYFCGFRVNSGEYKLMGLAPYGEPRYASRIEGNVIRIEPDGAFRLNMSYFDFLDPQSRHLAGDRLADLLGGPRRGEDDSPEGFYADVAASAQAIFEKAVVNIARTARERTGARNLCLAGGSALNCVANSRIAEEAVFDDIWVQPASGDAGGALGAALQVWHGRLSHERAPAGRDAMQGALLGPGFSDSAVRGYLDSVGATYAAMTPDELVELASGWLADGKIVAWFQGRQEFGPRALGSRSILADPRPTDMQRHLNHAVKNRESFRPFAPAVTSEAASEHFATRGASPYMLFTVPVRERNDAQSGLSAVTHVDGSARVQTVDRDEHPLFWRLIDAFGRRTGTPVLVNTSFNVRGEPIVCTPEDALKTFLRGQIDYLCIGNTVLDRRDQQGLDLVIEPVPESD